MCPFRLSMSNGFAASKCASSIWASVLSVNRFHHDAHFVDGCPHTLWRELTLVFKWHFLLHWSSCKPVRLSLKKTVYRRTATVVACQCIELDVFLIHFGEIVNTSVDACLPARGGDAGLRFLSVEGNDICHESENMQFYLWCLPGACDHREGYHPCVRGLSGMQRSRRCVTRPWSWEVFSQRTVPPKAPPTPRTRDPTRLRPRMCPQEARWCTPREVVDAKFHVHSILEIRGSHTIRQHRNRTAEAVRVKVTVPVRSHVVILCPILAILHRETEERGDFFLSRQRGSALARGGGRLMQSAMTGLAQERTSSTLAEVLSTRMSDSNSRAARYVLVPCPIGRTMLGKRSTVWDQLHAIPAPTCQHWLW